MNSLMEKIFERSISLQQSNYKDIDGALLQKIQENRKDIEKIVTRVDKCEINDIAKNNKNFNRGGRGGKRGRSVRGRAERAREIFDHGKIDVLSNMETPMHHFKKVVHNNNFYGNNGNRLISYRNEKCRRTQNIRMDAISSETVTIMTDPSFIVDNLNLLVSECIKTFIENNWISNDDCNKSNVNNNKFHNGIKIGEMKTVKNELIKKINISKCSNESSKITPNLNFCVNNINKNPVQLETEDTGINSEIITNKKIFVTSRNEKNLTDDKNSIHARNRLLSNIKSENIDPSNINYHDFYKDHHHDLLLMDRMKIEELKSLSPSILLKKQNSCSFSNVISHLKKNIADVTSAASTTTSTPIGTTAYPSRSCTSQGTMHLFDNAAENDIISFGSRDFFSSSSSFSSSSLPSLNVVPSSPDNEKASDEKNKATFCNHKNTEIERNTSFYCKRKIEENKCSNKKFDYKNETKENINKAFFFPKKNNQCLSSGSALTEDNYIEKKILYRNLLSSAWNRHSSDSSKDLLGKKFFRSSDVMTRQRSVLLRRDGALIADMKIIAEFGQNENSFYEEKTKNKLLNFSERPPSKFNDIMSSYIIHLYWGRKSLLEAYRQQNVDLLLKVADNEMLKTLDKQKNNDSCIKQKALTPQKTTVTNTSGKRKFVRVTNNNTTALATSNNSRCSSVTKRLQHKETEKQKIQKNFQLKVEDLSSLQLNQLPLAVLEATQEDQISKSVQQEVHQKQQQDEIQIYRDFNCSQSSASSVTRSNLSTIVTSKNNLEKELSKKVLEKHNDVYCHRPYKLNFCTNAAAIIEEATRAAEIDEDDKEKTLTMKSMMMVTRLASRCPKMQKTDDREKFLPFSTVSN